MRKPKIVNIVLDVTQYLCHSTGMIRRVTVSDNATEKWEVQTNTMCDGWVNTWHDGEELLTFGSEAEAQADLDEFLHEMAEAASRGDVEDEYSREDYRIVRVS